MVIAIINFFTALRVRLPEKAKPELGIGQA